MDVDRWINSSFSYLFNINLFNGINMLKKIMTICSTAFLCSKTFSKQINAMVVKVIDGDTIVVTNDDEKYHKIRLYGIDTPDKNQPYFKEAKEYLISLVINKDVKVYYHKRGFFKRIIGKIYIGPEYINLNMVLSGHAWHYEKYAKNDLGLMEAQIFAKFNKLGLWKDNNPIPPWEWRKNKKKFKDSQYWINTDSQVRHNPSCTFYNKTTFGHKCKKTEGTKCNLCGG